MLDNLFYLIILILGFPAGLILARMCRDEIKNWRKIFIFMSIICLIIVIVLSFINFEYKVPAILSLFFIVITSLTIVWKSY